MAPDRVVSQRRTSYPALCHEGVWWREKWDGPCWLLVRRVSVFVAWKLQRSLKVKNVGAGISSPYFKALNVPSRALILSLLAHALGHLSLTFRHDGY